MDKVALSLKDNSTCSTELRCVCTQLDDGEYKSDCSSLDLHDFPEFLDNVKEITFFNNSFNLIPEYSCLPKGLTHLDISKCKLKEIHKGFLQPFSRLEYLDISHNRELSLEVLPTVTYDLQFTNIKILKFNAIQCKYGKGLKLKQAYLHYLKNTSLEEIHLSSNRIEVLEQFVLRNAPGSLQRITAADNRLFFSWAMLEIHYLEKITFVDLSRQFSSSTSFLSLLEKNCNDSKPNKKVENTFQLPYPYQLKRSTKPMKLESCLKDFITIPPRKEINIYIC